MSWAVTIAIDDCRKRNYLFFFVAQIYYTDLVILCELIKTLVVFVCIQTISVWLYYLFLSERIALVCVWSLAHILLFRRKFNRTENIYFFILRQQRDVAAPVAENILLPGVLFLNESRLTEWKKGKRNRGTVLGLGFDVFSRVPKSLFAYIMCTRTTRRPYQSEVFTRSRTLLPSRS